MWIPWHFFRLSASMSQELGTSPADSSRLHGHWELPSVAVQFSSVQLCPTLFHPTDCRTPGFPVHHQLPECAQTHVRWVRELLYPGHTFSMGMANEHLVQGMLQDRSPRTGWGLHCRAIFPLCPSFLSGLSLHCVCAKSLQSCLTLCDPMNCSLPGSSVHGIL